MVLFTSSSMSIDNLFTKIDHENKDNYVEISKR